MITKTDAVVLKSMKYRDSSKIVTFYTRRFGKLKGIAKGARQMKSKFGASLEPISAVSLILYKKEHRDLQLISECDVVTTYKTIHSELDRMAVALSVLELLNQLTHDEEGNDALYLLLVQTLDEVERAKKNCVNLLFAFEIRCAAVFGFAPNLEVCLVCHRSLDDIGSGGSAVFQLSRGAVLCSRCGQSAKVTKSDNPPLNPTRSKVGTAWRPDEGNTRVSVETLKTLQRLLTAPLDTVSSLELSSAQGNEIDGTLRLYLRQHFEDLKPLKSMEILKNYTISGSKPSGRS